MLLNNKTLIMVESEKEYLRLHYADGHYEIVPGKIRNYIIKNKKGYKNPIDINNHLLYPTKNIHDVSCNGVNLEVYEEINHYYVFLLECYGIEHQVCKMYLKHKKDLLKQRKES